MNKVKKNYVLNKYYTPKDGASVRIEVNISASSIEDYEVKGVYSHVTMGSATITEDITMFSTATPFHEVIDEFIAEHLDAEMRSDSFMEDVDLPVAAWAGIVHENKTAA